MLYDFINFVKTILFSMIQDCGHLLFIDIIPDGSSFLK